MDGDKKNILIVEDEGIIAFHIKKLLLGYGYGVLDIVATAEDAIEKADSLNPDLVLMDITLKSERDGVFAADVIRQKKNIPIIFLTANTDERTLHRAKIVEPYGFINKPFQGRELKTNIEIAIYTHKMRKKLFENEQLLAATLGSINEGVIAADNENIIKFVNLRACELCGYSQDEVIGKNLNEIYQVEEDTSNENLICNLSGIISGHQDKEFFDNKLLQRKDGSKLPIEEEYREMRDFNNKISGNVLVFRDMSKKREAQIELIRSRNYYLSLFDSIPALIWQTNTTGEFNYFNSTWLNYRNKKIENEVGDRWINDIHPDDKENFIYKFTGKREHREKFYGEFRIKNNNGEYNWLICVASPYKDMQNNFAGYLGVCQDISSLKKIENALLMSKIEAENANEAKSKFISMMSHELRTPMNGILGMIELLKSSKLTNEQNNYLNILSQGAYNLLNTINSILNISKTDAGKYKINNVEFSINKVCSEVIESYKVLAASKNVKLSYDIKENIPDKLFADEEKIKQILTNILNNAVKFTNSGEIKLKIVMSKSQSDKNEFVDLLITIEDTGIGIPKDKLELVFESFKQADELFTREYGGVGLGLSISKQLAGLLGGEIWVESELNVGSKFFVSLKVQKTTEGISV